MNNSYILPSRNWILVILIIYIFSLFLHIDRIPLKFEEPRRGLVALEMMYSDNYIVPTLNGINYYNKPPVFNWVLIALFKITGSTEEWVVRIPTVFSLLAIGAILFVFCRKHMDQEIALFATLFWLTSADIYFHFSIVGEIDLFFTLLVVLQVFGIYHFYIKGQYGWLFISSYIFMSIGILTKGLPSIAFQGLTLIALSITFKKWKWLFHPMHFISIFSAIAIVGGYFYAYSLQENVWPFLVRLFSESSERTPLSKGFMSTLRHALLFPFLHLKLLLPWLVYAGVMVRKAHWNAFFKHDLLKFAFFFCLLNVVPYWISPGTKDRYLYPFIPLAMVGIAWTFVNYYGISRISKWIDGLMMAFIIMFALLPFSLSEFEELSNVKLLWLKGGLFVAVFVGLGMAFYKYKQYRIWVFILVFIAARIVFDFIIIPGREYAAMNFKKFKVSAIDLANTTKGENVYWLSDKEEIHKTINIPFVFQKEVIVNEPEWADFALSFYFSKYHDSILQYTEQFERGKFHLVLESELARFKDYKLVERYHLPERERTYVLIK